MTTTIEETEQTVEAPPVAEPTQFTIPAGFTPRESYPNSGEQDGQFTLYVTRVKAGDREGWPGTFRFASCSRDNDEWISGNRRVYGAVVNGTPRSGVHYLVFGKYVVRYNNEYEIGLRHHRTSPWSVVAGPEGEPWLLPNDHVPEISPDDHYMAVTFDMSNLGQSAESPEWEDGYANVTHGLHKAEEDGSVILNPDLHVGHLYLCWNQDAVANGTEFVRLGMYVGGGDIEQAFAYSGHYYKGSSEYSMPDFSAQYTYETVADRWVKFGFRTATVATATATTAYERNLTRLNAEFEKFNEETNKLAREHSWCSSYEGITSRLGMKSRWHGWWYAEVQATVCVNRAEMEGYSARDILSLVGVSGRVIRNLSMEAEITFRVSALRSETEDSARELVDEAAVKKALKKLSLDATEVTAFEVTGVYEDRDSAARGDQDDDEDEGNPDDF